MIISGCGFTAHDASLCVSINGKIKYSKYEREVGLKHETPDDVFAWYLKKLNDWNIKETDVVLSVLAEESSWYNSNSKSKIHFKKSLIGRNFLRIDNKTLLIDHHLAHIWSNTNMTNKSQATALDGGGSYNPLYLREHRAMQAPQAYKSITYSNQKIQKTGEYSAGNIYASLASLTVEEKTRYEFNDLPGKLMGLIPYGNFDIGLYNLFMDLVQSYGQKHYLDTYPVLEYLQKMNIEKSPNNQKWLDILATVDTIMYESIKKYFLPHDKSKEIIYSGGTAANVTWNKKLLDEGYKLDIQPPIYDGGISIGCLRYGHEYLGIEQPDFGNFPYIQDDISPENTPTSHTIDRVVELLANGKIVGWYQGNGELGPRALGNRSILMDPTIQNGKDIINQKVKRREWWRPFGATVLQEKASQYFDLEKTPYMLFSSQVKSTDFPSITHVDGTCRHQTLNYDTNPLYYELISKFETKTGIPMLLNTSLNLGGKPIAADPADALQLLKNSEMDAVCIGNDLYEK